MFELFYVGFGQAIAFFSANELLASLYVPFFFLFVIAPYAALPTFWRSRMHSLTPFNYLLEGFFAAVSHDVPAICDTN
jgi:ATP-binding cassette, subfamily G (WHITE), member 2, SNQ2